MSRAASIRRRSLALAAIVCAVALAGVLARALLLGDDAQTIRAEVASAAQLRADDPVRVAGIEVGRVDDIELRSDGTAELFLRVDEDLTIMRDARVALRWRTLLGGAFYVDLDPGQPAVGASRSRRIPRSRTTTQVEFDQLLQPFDGGTTRATQTLLAQLRRGLARPAALGRSINALAPALDAIGRGLPPLHGRRDDDLRRLVASTARTLTALGEDEGRLRELFDGATGTLRVTAARHAELGRLIALTPRSLASTQTTMRRIDATLARLDPLAVALRPGARRLAPALRVARPMLERTRALLTDARPLLRRLDPALASLGSAARSGRPLLAALDPIVQRLDDELLPWLRRPDPEVGRSTAQLIGPTLAASAAAAAEYDDEGNWLRFAPVPGERLLLPAPCRTFLSDPTATEKLRCDELEAALDGLFRGARR